MCEETRAKVPNFESHDKQRAKNNSQNKTNTGVRHALAAAYQPCQWASEAYAPWKRHAATARFRKACKMNASQHWLAVSSHSHRLTQLARIRSAVWHHSVGVCGRKSSCFETDLCFVYLFDHPIRTYKRSFTAQTGRTNRKKAGPQQRKKIFIHVHDLFIF